MSLLNSFFSALKTNVMDYCDIEAPYHTKKNKNTFVLRNGGFMTMYEIMGATTFIGESGFLDQIEVLNDKLGKTLEKEGYRLEFVFIRDPKQTKRTLEKNILPLRRTAKALELDVEGLLEERMDVLSKNLVYERCFLTIKTNPTVLPSKTIARSNKKRIEKAGAAGVKPGMYAQSPYTAFDELFVSHTGFCDLVSEGLSSTTKIRAMDHNEALLELKLQIEPYSTGSQWKPSLSGDKVRAKLIKEVNLASDISHLTNLDLGQQLFTRRPELTDEDHTSVKHDGVYYAPLIVDGAQAKPTEFSKFFTSVPKDVPWRLNISIDTGHENILKKIGNKRGFSAFLAFSNGQNKLIRDACEELIQIGNTETLVSTQVSICTWGDSYEEMQIRKENINQFFQNWGGLDIVDEAGDPIEAWLNNMPGLSGKKIATPIALPLLEVLYMLPISRPSSAWDTGTTIFNTVDYKVYPTESATSIQSNTADLIFAPPGSGKSFLLSALNMALILKPGNTKLPKIKIIDIGFSSASFVQMIKEALPDHLGYLAQSITLENNSNKAINMFQTPLGCRKPLSMDLSTQAGLLELLLTPAGQGQVERLPELSYALVVALYEKLSDENEPNQYRVGIEEDIDELLLSLNFNTSYERSWWEVVDTLFKEGHIQKASQAQRHAMPLLTDVSAMLQDQSIRTVFEEANYNGESLLDFAGQMVISAVQAYPILTQPSVIDVSSARILSIDLQNVAKRGNSNANKQTAIMYLLTKSLCCADYYIVKDTLSEINPDYRDYFEELIESEAGIPKKLCMDEFHRTEGFPQVRNSVETDIREGRKYGIIISLLSQSLDDFTKIMIEFSTNIYILAKGISEETPRKIKEKFSPTNDSMQQFRMHVKAPGKEGSSMLYIADVNNSDTGVECVVRLRLGPEEIWAYSTTPNDVALRSALVKEIGLNSALKILAKEFPGGSCQKYLENFKRELTDFEENPVQQLKHKLLMENKKLY